VRARPHGVRDQIITTRRLRDERVEHPTRDAHRSKETQMAPRRTQRELQDAKKAVRQEEMQRAIAEGRLIVRQMTTQERQDSDARSTTARANARNRRHGSS
jgi:hypothetical protein